MGAQLSGCPSKKDMTIRIDCNSAEFMHLDPREVPSETTVVVPTNTQDPFTSFNWRYLSSRIEISSAYAIGSLS